MVSIQVEAAEFPVEKIRFPNSSLAGPAPDIQIVSKRRVAGGLSCLSSSWFAGSAVRARSVPAPSQEPTARMGGLKVAVARESGVNFAIGEEQPRPLALVRRVETKGRAIGQCMRCLD